MRKPINGTNGRYEIDSSGIIFSVPKNGNIKEIGGISNSGYKVVSIKINNKLTHATVHRLVAEHFVNNTNNYNCVDHIDGNKLNNDASNLRWCTDKQNQDFRKEQNNSGKEFGYIGGLNNKPIRIMYDNKIYESKNKLAEYLSTISKATKKCIIKTITAAIKRNGTVYGKKVTIVD